MERESVEDSSAAIVGWSRARFKLISFGTSDIPARARAAIAALPLLSWGAFSSAIVCRPPVSH
jgi:hypothetical protein